MDLTAARETVSLQSTNLKESTTVPPEMGRHRGDVTACIQWPKVQSFLFSAPLFSQTNGAEKRINGAEKRTNGAEKRKNGAERRTNGVEKRTNGAEKRTNGAEKRTNGAEKRTNGAEKRTNGAEKRTNGAEKRTNGAEKRTNGAEKRTNGAEKRKCTLGPLYLQQPGAVGRNLLSVKEQPFGTYVK